jgi:glycosyltransferase involved in cell wall biosynthesis
VYSVVVLCWNARYLSLPVALLLGNIQGCPIVLWGHGYSKHEARVRRAYRNLLGAGARNIMLYSSHPIAALPKGVRPKVVVVGNALFRREPIKGRKKRQSSQTCNVNILHIGRLRPDRGLETAITALVKLEFKGFDARFDIVGDGPHRKSLETLATQVGVGDRVSFHGVLDDESRVSELFDSADVAIYARHGGVGVLEALEHGVPAILCGSRWQHPPESEIVYRRFPDLVDESDSPEGVAQVVEHALANTDVLSRVSAVVSELQTERRLVVERFVKALKSARGSGRKMSAKSSERGSAEAAPGRPNFVDGAEE